jgi:hypothetical protein
MSKIRNIAIAGALAFATVVPVVAEAGPMMNTQIKVEKTSDVTNVRCGRWNCRGWRGNRGWRGRYWGPRRVWIAPRIVVGPRVVVRRGYNAHARWCMSRYASYNPRTNTFLAYDGYYKRCVSPY